MNVNEQSKPVRQTANAVQRIFGKSFRQQAAVDSSSAKQTSEMWVSEEGVHDLPRMTEDATVTGLLFPGALDTP